MNVLYIGVNNPISFAVENVECKDLAITIENGVTTRTGDCSCDITVTKPGVSYIFLIKGKDTLYKTQYRIKNLPDPATTWGNQGPYWFLLDSLRSQNGLVATMNKFDYDARFSIVGFEITVLRARKLAGSKNIYCNECLKKIENERYETVFSAKNEGATFNDSLKTFIRNKLAIGDRVFIEEIKAMGPDNRIRQLGTISFSVQ